MLDAMTTTTPAAASRPARVASGPSTPRRIVGGAAIAGTLPYLGLKAAWLTGHPVGLEDLSMLSSTTMAAFNAATVAMDLGLIALAVALTSTRGRRLPALAVLLPGWVATGLLLPIAVSVLPATLVSGAGTGDGLAGWVRPMVYGGFAWQGLFLMTAFALYARDRWAAAVRDAGPVPEPVRPLLRATLGGGTAMAALSAPLQVLAGATSAAGVTGLVAGLANAAFAVAGAAGVLALARGTRVTTAVLAGWTGSAAMFSWGLWTAVTTMGAAAEVGAGGLPAYGLAQLAGLLGGFALAVAGLLSLSGPRST